MLDLYSDTESISTNNNLEQVLKKLSMRTSQIISISFSRQCQCWKPRLSECSQAPNTSLIAESPRINCQMQLILQPFEILFLRESQVVKYVP